MKDRLRLRTLVLMLSVFLLSTANPASQTVPVYKITGQVNDEFGQPLAGVRLCAQAGDFYSAKEAFCALSNAEGNFVISPAKPGRYKIFADRLSGGYYPQNPFFKYPAESIPEVVLDDARSTAIAFVRLPPKNGELVGKAIDAGTGRPVESVRLNVCQAAHRKMCWAKYAKGLTGEFKLFAAHVPFTFQLFAEGYETWSGVYGSDINQFFSIPSGSKMEVLVLLKRLQESINRPLSEAEKQPGINLPAPVQTGPDDNAELDVYPRKTLLKWQPVEGAASYRIEIDYCQGPAKGQHSCIDPQPHYIAGSNAIDSNTTSYEFNFVGAQPGRWRVWAIDKKGQESFKSPWRTFFYLH